MNSSDEHVDVAPVGFARTSGFKRVVIRLLRFVVILYVGLCIVLYGCQTAMMFPGRSTQGQRHAVVPASRDGNYELVTLQTKSGTKIVAAFGKAMFPNGQIRPDHSTRPTVLLFYGNGMCLADAMDWLREFRELGANVMIPDYAGYGMSGGAPSEKSLYETGDACWEYLETRTDLDMTKIVPTGVSIGGGVALELASRKPACAVATFSAFTSMPDMAHSLFPWLPTSWLVTHRFENEKKIREIRIPTFIAHGREDRIIPFAMSERLKNAAGGAVTYLPVDTDHNDLFELAGVELLAAFGQFLEANCVAPSTSD